VAREIQVQVAELEKIAQDAGFPGLRPPQRKALELLSQGHPLLIVWPTGSGKSLCYQLPAMASGDLTLVVSPLIALMEDQTAKCRALGWPVTCVHSAVRGPEREARLKKVKGGGVKLLYVTPERFRSPEFLDVLKSRRVALLAVDEAHCISQWGHDFRPDYSRLGEIRKLLGNPQTIALTATATREVQADIVQQLGMGPQASVLWEGVERPNLHLSAVECDGEEEKMAALEDWLRSVSGPKIVYCTLISRLEKLSEWLQVRGFAHEVYHGERGDSERKRAGRAFLEGDAQLMLATPAFGLGVDKPDIRGVAHFEIPGSLESYFQEVGRAGRDGAKSWCRLFYHQEDLTTQMQFIETLTPDPDFVRATYKLLVSWKDRLPVSRLDDLREQLSFKNKRDYRLETALSFLDRWEVIRFPHRRLDKLEFLRDLEEGDLSAEMWKARKLSLQKKLMSLVQWFRSEECRKVGIYKYFGWDANEPCGFCDRCDQGAR
jgi:ATP-dependent DNA helicase RecQ